MKSKKAKGWGIPDQIGLEVDGIEVRLGCVCTCNWRKQHCYSGKKCQDLFRIGGTEDDIRTLKALMGKDFPKCWEDQKLWVTNYEEAEKRSEAFNRFKKEYFKKCHPVEIEISVKKSS